MAGPLFRAISPTPMVTVQDGGRRGWRRFGLSGSGAMDRMSLAAANALAGNAPAAAALEFAYAGGEWMVEATNCRIAVAGGPFDVNIDGMKVPAFSSMVLRPGQTLRIGEARQRVWGYLAVAGGFDLPLAFGARATHVRTEIGGLEGRAIQAGDALPLRLDQMPGEPERTMDEPPEAQGDHRLVIGPQERYFGEEAIATFLSQEYEVTWQQDRMAYRLDGPVLRHRHGYDMISEGVMPGCIQVPGTGLPIVLMRDAGTVGGYPKIGTIIEADLGRLAQSRPGTKIRFKAVTVAEAQAARRRFLAGLQLISDVSSGPPP